MQPAQQQMMQQPVAQVQPQQTMVQQPMAQVQPQPNMMQFPQEMAMQQQQQPLLIQPAPFVQGQNMDNVAVHK